MIRHTVRVAAGRGAEPIDIENVLHWDVSNDLLELADDFSFSVPFDPVLFAVLQPDAEVELWIDDARVLTGFVDDLERSASKGGGSILTVTGRDRGGRLVDESAPFLTFGEIGVLELARTMGSPWFEEVVLSNVEDRRLRKGRSGRSQARASWEPLYIPEGLDESARLAIAQASDRVRTALKSASSEPAGKVIGLSTRKKVEPGESRADVLMHFMEEAGWLMWSSADGRQLIVGKPQHDQEPTWRFVYAPTGHPRAGECNVLSLGDRRSTGERYAKITACGSSRGDSSRYGPNVTKRIGVALNGPNADGTGKHFTRPKSLVVVDDDVRTEKQAKDRAEREMRLRDASGREVTLTVAGFGQRFGGDSKPSLFTFDTIARFEDLEADTLGDFYVTRVRFVEDKQGGQHTEISLVPRGTELVQ